MNTRERYEYAKEKYAKIGVDTEAAMELLKDGYSFEELYKAAKDYNFD